MTVLLVNGSPHVSGCTFTALCEIESVLNKEGINTAWFHIGNKAVNGCQACGVCRKTGRCRFEDDPTNPLVEAMAAADGIVVGSPVYFAGPNGALCALLDKAFYSSSAKFAGKPAAAIASCRRGGSSATLDRLNKYFTYCRMPLVSSQYWNMVHGTNPEEVRKDEEGMQIMRTLGHQMARLLTSLEGHPLPEAEALKRTNFIR